MQDLINQRENAEIKASQNLADEIASAAVKDTGIGSAFYKNNEAVFQKYGISPTWSDAALRLWYASVKIPMEFRGLEVINGKYTVADKRVKEGVKEPEVPESVLVDKYKTVVPPSTSNQYSLEISKLRADLEALRAKGITGSVSPEYLVNVISKSDELEAKRLDKLYLSMEKLIKWNEEYLKNFDKLYPKEVDYDRIQRELDKRNDTILIKIDKKYGEFMESLKGIGYGALKGTGDLFEDLGMKNLSGSIDTLQDTLARYVTGLAASQLAFESGEKSFAEALGQFRALSNLSNLGISTAGGSGKYRTSKTKKPGYLKSKYGNYYYQAIR